MVTSHIQKFILAVAVMVLLSACSITPAEQRDLSGAYSDLTNTVLSKGDTPKEFNLPDSSGMKFSLATQLQTHHVLLIFYRGDWCPYCIDQFSTIQPVLPQIKQHGVKLLAISPDDAATAENTQRKFGQDYAFLTDTDLAVTQSYGLASDKELPHPAVFLLRKANSLAASEVVWMYASTDHTKRPNGEQLLQVIKTELQH